MSQKKYWIVGVLVGVAVVGLAAWLLLSRSEEPVDYGRASLHETVTPNETKSDSGLNVSSNAASNLGQLTPGQTGNASGTSGSSGGASSSAPTGPDPTTFAQYEKYKNENNALFGDMQVGNGAELTANKKAAVYYKGWLTNGQMFDQSRPGSDGKLQPFVFELGAHQVIPGWEQGLAGMKVGGTRLVIVPPSVGYGANGQGSIPPNSVLVFEVQLLAVQ